MLEQSYRQLRQRSENNGAGERELMAGNLGEILTHLSDKERDSVAGEVTTSIVRSSEILMRQGKSLDQVLDEVVSDDPLDIAATDIAYKIYRLGHEPEPDYEESNLKDYPAYQRSFAESAWKEMKKAGFSKVGDYEPLHLRELLGKPTLVRIYSGDNATIFAASYRAAPKWPGLIVFLVMFLTGKWKKPSVVELETALSDGHFIITNNSGSLNPFNYGGNIDIRKMSSDTKATDLIERHRKRVADYLNSHDHTHPLRASGLEEICALLKQLSVSKNEYRKSIGYASEDELQSMLGRQYAKLAPRVRARLNALAQAVA
jgi:hypothetical protein